MGHHHCKKHKSRARAALQGVPMPEAHVNWLGHSLKPKCRPSSFRVTVAMDQAGVFFAHITRHSSPQVVALNGGIPLSPSVLYVFEFMVHKGDTINFACDTGPHGNIQVLRVDEIDASAAQSSVQSTG